MGHSQTDKAQSRERILTEAAAQVRDAGLESVSVGKLMRSVNLTHGGFYGHFGSRSDLLAQALARALEDGAAASRAAVGASGSPQTFDTLVRGYLSRRHRDARKSGCAIAALASDVARADEPSRQVMTDSIERLIAKVEATMNAGDDEAMFAASAMVGALLLSRVITDPKRSDALLHAVKAGLARQSPSGRDGD